MSEPAAEQTIRISARWILLTGLVILLLGGIGGAIGNYFWIGPQTPLVITGTDDGQPIATVQEVKISPSKARAEAVKQATISTLLLATSQGTRTVPFATGLVVTNDGLVVTTADTPSEGYVAFDHLGSQRPLDLLGRDEVFGLTYFRLRDTIIVPLQARDESVDVGTSLTAVTRDPNTFGPQAHIFAITQEVLPVSSDPSGVQRLFQGTPLATDTSVGSPLVDEAGLIAGMFTDPAAGKALSIKDINLSLARVSAGERELDPFESLGFAVQFQIDTTEAQGTRFSALVDRVVPGGHAGEAGLKTDDRIIAIGGEELNWDRNVVSSLSLTDSYIVTVIRDEQELDLTFTPQLSG